MNEAPHYQESTENKALAAATMGGGTRTEAREELHLSCVRRRSMATLSRAAACRGSRVRSVVAHGQGGCQQRGGRRVVGEL